MMSNRSPRWALLQWLDIPDSIDPDLTYLRRLRIITTPWFGVMLHWIYLPDRDRDPHDHPWNFASVVLRGGYREVLYHPHVSLAFRTVRYWPRFSWHTIEMSQAHRITDIERGTLTLVFTGRRSRSWGFWTPDGFVDWREYTNAQEDP